MPLDALRARVEGRVPRRLPPGSFADVAFIVTNLGDATLESELPNPVHVAYRWLVGGERVGNEPRVPLPRALPPGERTVVEVPLRAPDAPGDYSVRITLVQEHVAWFDELDRESALDADVRVRSARRVPLIRRHPVVERFPPVNVPWRGNYAERHRALVAAVLRDPQLMRRFRAFARLPRGYGLGFDERVIEFPWALAHDLRVPILDAGSTLNHRHVLETLGECLGGLTILTLAPEPESFPELGPTYVYEDLRSLPFDDATFQTITCLSTLEHVGMDNARFGADVGRSPDPLSARDLAVAELRRVLAPGGTILITVPFGRAEDIGWQLQFDARALDRVREVLDPVEWDVRVYAYSRRGWQLSSVADAADASFEDHSREPHRASDGAAAARAVACVRATV